MATIAKITNPSLMTPKDFEQAFKDLEELELMARFDSQRERIELKWAELEELQQEFIGGSGE